MTTKGFHKNFIFPLFSVAALTGVSGCCLIPGYTAPMASTAALTQTAMPTVIGSATYRERMMAPAGSVLKVVLQDTSRADAAAITLAEWTAPLVDGGLPKAFSLTPTAPLDPRLTYTVRATILGPDAALLWTTDTAHRVPAGAAGPIEMGELVMVKVAPYEPPASPLGGGVWIITSIGGAAVTGERPPTLLFGDDGRVIGFGGCNRFMGGYTQAGAKVSFSEIAMTMMACLSDTSNQQESALGGALRGEATFMINGDGQLTLTGENGTEIAAMQAPDLKLAGTRWSVEGMGGVAVVSGHEPSLTFTEDGKINGTTGCNSFFGGYTQDGDRLSFTGVGMTKMACMGDGIMAQESALAAMLSGEATARIVGLGNLTITGADGVGFVASPVRAEAAPGDPALLTGAAWIVEDLNRMGVIDNSRLTLAFGADGRVNGSTNCNSFAGSYSVDGSKLLLSPLAMTRRACIGEALANQETRYVGALSGELGWRFAEDGALVLTGDEDTRVLLRR